MGGVRPRLDMAGRGRVIAVLGAQVVTYLILGVYFLSVGNWRLGVAQLLLAAVQGVLFSDGLA